MDAGDVLASLAQATGEAPERCTERLRRLAFGFFLERSGRREGYPRLYVFQGYQAAGLTLLRECSDEIGEHAETMLAERFPGTQLPEMEPPPGFPPPDTGLGLTTVFTELRRHPALRKRLWPEPDGEDFRSAFRRREQRRELLSAMARLGAPYVDLYLLAIALIGSFSLGLRQETENAAELAAQFVRLLELQADEPGFHAFHELSQAAEAFDHILAVNFPEAPSCPLPELARLYGVTLQKQVPVGRMSGGVNQRLVRQFRMPGFPLVLITTDVLQEGEDLHTFCRRVVHYGIAWTPSAMEQRTGRVDRIGGLVQRCLDGSSGPAAPDELIQVYYPHLRDTVELLQVRRVLRRLNRFLRLIHRGDGVVEADDKAIDASRALLEEIEDLPPIEGKLESAFPIESRWLDGELRAGHAILPDWTHLYRHLDALWWELCERYPITESMSREPRLRRGEFLAAAAGGRMQPFTFGLRSQVAGAEILIECESTIGFVDLQDDEVVNALMSELAGNSSVKLCVDPRVGKHQDRIYVRREVLFDSDATRLDDVAAMFESTLLPSVRLHALLEAANLLGARVD